MGETRNKVWTQQLKNGKHGKILQMKDKHGKILQMEDKHGKILQMSDKHGKILQMRDKHGKILQMKDKHGKILRIKDKHGRRREQQTPTTVRIYPSISVRNYRVYAFFPMSRDSVVKHVQQAEKEIKSVSGELQQLLRCQQIQQI